MLDKESPEICFPFVGELMLIFGGAFSSTTGVGIGGVLYAFGGSAAEGIVVGGLTSCFGRLWGATSCFGWSADLNRSGGRIIPFFFLHRYGGSRVALSKVQYAAVYFDWLCIVIHKHCTSLWLE